MRYNQLGRTGLFVSELCLGTMTFGGEGRGMWQNIGTLEQEAVDALVKRALDAGINFIDTADVYSEGRSEELLGQALKNLGVTRSDVVIATKFHGSTGKGPNDRGGSRGHIMDAVEKSLERLDLDHIDLYQIHGLDTVTPPEETLRALDDLVRAGKVRYIGSSNHSGWTKMRALATSDRLGLTRYVSQQIRYSLLDRASENELLPLGVHEGVGAMIWGRSPRATCRASSRRAAIFPTPGSARAPTAPSRARTSIRSA